MIGPRRSSHAASTHCSLGRSCLEKVFDVFGVHRPDLGTPRQGEDDDGCIDNVTGLGPGEQMSSLVRVVFLQRNNLASAKHSAQLSLLRRATGLRDHWSRDERHESGLEVDSMLCPDASVVPISGNQDAGVVYYRPQEAFLRTFRAGRSSARAGFTGGFKEDATRVRASNRCRAAPSSASVNGPCSASHSATAASPSRTRNTCFAAAVNQADRLEPSASAARKTLACTSASMVMASLVAGFPRGMHKPYYCGMTIQGLFTSHVDVGRCCEAVLDRRAHQRSRARRALGHPCGRGALRRRGGQEGRSRGWAAPSRRGAGDSARAQRGPLRGGCARSRRAARGLRACRRPPTLVTASARTSPRPSNVGATSSCRIRGASSGCPRLGLANAATRVIDAVCAGSLMHFVRRTFGRWLVREELWNSNPRSEATANCSRSR